MSDHICWLITILYEGRLLKCALSVKKELLTQDCMDFPMDPENREKIHAMLPLHIRSCGPIVDFEEIFEVA